MSAMCGRAPTLSSGVGVQAQAVRQPGSGGVYPAADSDNDHDLALFSKNLGQQRAGSFAPTTSRRRSMSHRPGCTIWPGKWIAGAGAYSSPAGRTRHSGAGRGSRRAQKHLWPRSGRAAVRGDLVYSAGVADRRGQNQQGIRPLDFAAEKRRFAGR